MPSQDIPRTRTLHLPVHGLSLPAPEDRTLLQTMQQAGVPWPASCRNGTCRSCIGHLVSGTVRYGVEWPGLLPEEKTGGAVLPCVAFATSEVTLVPPRD
ncbi:2Fe-2S iron-sulfur cluster-binding protein [Hydrogenophaga sp. MI9]|uniref:2Fe-2S iron-sulfur cluster-binding protein n=1 Tax=Hydrogenophaga sp. MI9 TaxID=3453719 RepID=UPI003EEF1790